MAGMCGIQAFLRNDVLRLNSAVGRFCDCPLRGENRTMNPCSARRSRATHLQEKLLLLALDLLFHLLIQMLDFFIIGSNFPTWTARGDAEMICTCKPTL